MNLLQVSWIWEPVDGQRDNIAVFHPMYGQSFPNPAFKERVVFLHNDLRNPSIKIKDLRMSDAGRYTCEYATYPTGNEQGTTTLIMLGEEQEAAVCVFGVTWRFSSESLKVPGFWNEAAARSPAPPHPAAYLCFLRTTRSQRTPEWKKEQFKALAQVPSVDPGKKSRLNIKKRNYLLFTWGWKCGGSDQMSQSDDSSSGSASVGSSSEKRFKHLNKFLIMNTCVLFRFF